MDTLGNEPTREARSTNWASTPLRLIAISLFWLPLSLFWSMMLAQILPARVEDFAGPLTKGRFLGEISWMGAAAAAVIQLVVGPLSDHCRARLGRRRPFLLIGTLGAVLAMVQFAYAQSFAGLVFCYFAIQLLLNVANGPYQAFIPDHTPVKKQGSASAAMSIMELLGQAGGPLIAGTLLAGAAGSAAKTHHVILELMLMNAALLLAGMFVSVFVVPDRPSTSREPLAATFRSMTELQIRQHSPFYLLLVSRTVYNIGFYLALGFLAFYVQDSLGFGKNYHGPLMIIQVIAIGGGLLSALPAGYLADRTSKKRIIYVSCILTFCATLAFAVAKTLLFAEIMAIAFGVGFGIFRAVDWAFACNVLPQEGGAAKYMAIWSLSATLPQVLAPSFGPVADILNRHYGLGAGWRAAMLLAAICGLLGVVLVRLVPEPDKAALEPEPIVILP